MGARGISTKEKMLLLIDDIETISKELLENMIAPKQERLSHSDQAQLINLVMSKNEDLKESLDLAKEQEEIEDQINEINREVGRHDQDIQSLQKSLKDAEHLLSTAIYQAKLKLEQISRAQTHSVNSEDLIRFAHRISSTNAVAAPANWQPGDVRRPYPTDLEMRMGYLGRLNDLPLSAQPTALLSDQTNMSTSNSSNPFPPWHPHAHHSGGGGTPEYGQIWHHQPPPVDSSRNNHDDSAAEAEARVELMSTDTDSDSDTDTDTDTDKIN